MSREAARPGPLRNPSTGGISWYHGTRASGAELAGGLRFTQHDPEMEAGGHWAAHWNALLGMHFAAHHSSADKFASPGSGVGGSSGGTGPRSTPSVIHARLHLGNPKIYASEHDMADDAFEHEYDTRKNYISHHQDPSYPAETWFGHDDHPGERPARGEWEDFDDWHDMGEEGEQPAPVYRRTQWLNLHPDKGGIVQRFRERLQAAGHDGITYGNEEPGERVRSPRPEANVAAIAFHPGQVEVVKHHALGDERRTAAIRYDEDGGEVGQHPEEYAHRETAPGRHRFSALDGWGNELGYADVREKPGHVWLHNLYVHPDDRGRGTAGQLVDNVIAHFPGREIRLHPHPSPEGWESEEDLGPDDDVLRDFYGRHGFGDYHPAEGDKAGSSEHMVRHASAGHDDEEDDEPDYDTCYHCQREHDPHEHADDADFDPDWEHILSGVPSVHRALGVTLPGHEHALVHDQRTPPEEAARAIVRHVTTGSPSEGHMHWSAPEGLEHVRTTFGGGGGHARERTSVVLHARTPDWEHVEHDPDSLIDAAVSPYRHPEYEVPIAPGAPVHLTGVSWAHAREGGWGEDNRWHDGPEPEWHHHDFRRPMQMEAAARWVPSSGIFAPTTGLDQRLFDEDGHLRPEVRSAVMARLDQALRADARLVDDDWHDYLRVYLAGGSASEWAGSRPNEGAQDLDVLIGADYELARGHSPALASMDDAQADAALNAALRSGFNETGWAPGFGGTWNLTGYVNHAAYDVRAIRPYAAYDASGMTWAVKPPHLPGHTLADFNPAVLAQARAVAAEARAILRLPEPLRTREARALWDRIHAGRSQAFSGAGEGWTDPGNVAEKWLAYAPGNLLGRVRGLALAKTAAADGPVYYHGTRAPLQEGQALTPGAHPSPYGERGEPLPYVFFTTDRAEADVWARSSRHSGAGVPRVYEVHPTGDVLRDAGARSSFMSGHPVQVGQRVPWGVGLKMHQDELGNRGTSGQVQVPAVEQRFRNKTAFIANVEGMSDEGGPGTHAPEDEPVVRGAEDLALARTATAVGPGYSWEGVSRLHPGVYGGREGSRIGGNAAMMAFDRPGMDAQPGRPGGWDLEYHRETVPLRHIDYARHRDDDPAVEAYRRGYASSPGDMTPPVLVHRHGVYQVADGHHRLDGAQRAGRQDIEAYVAHSPHEGVPFGTGDKAPFHGAVPESRHHGGLAREGDHVPGEEPVVRDQGDLGWDDNGWAAARREPWHAAAKLAQQEVRMSHPGTTLQFPRGEEGDRMAGQVLRHVGYPPGLTEGAFVSRHPHPEKGQSNPAWLDGNPGVTLHPDRWDYGTVAHESAHHVVLHNNGRGPNTPQTDEQVHGPEWAQAYARGLNRLSRNAGDDFLYHHQRFHGMIQEGLRHRDQGDLDAAESRLPPSRWIREGAAAEGATETASSLEPAADAPTRVVAAWDSSGSEKTGLYLRFGHWPEDERSFSGAGGYHEEGVSAYDLDRHGNPAIDHGLDRGHTQHYDDCDVDEFGTCQYTDPEPPDNDPREEMQGRVGRAEKNRRQGSDKPHETGHLVRGEMSGVGYDGEPLLKNVRRAGDWIDHRHLLIPGAHPHRLARDPSDEDYEPPEEVPPMRHEASGDGTTIRMVPPGEYGKYEYPDYPVKTLPALVRHFRKTNPAYWEKLRGDVERNGVQSPALARFQAGGRPLKRPRMMDGHNRAAAAWDLGIPLPVGDYDNQADYDAAAPHGREWFRENSDLKAQGSPPWRTEATRAEAATGYTDLGKRSGMIYLELPEDAVRHVKDGVDDHHITIVYLGKNVGDDAFAEACRRARLAAAQVIPLSGFLRGVESFEPGDGSDEKVPAFVPAYIPGISKLRALLEDLNGSEHRLYRPHVTLAYLEPGEDLPAPHPRVDVSFDRLHVKRGDEIVSYPLGTGIRQEASADAQRLYHGSGKRYRDGDLIDPAVPHRKVHPQSEPDKAYFSDNAWNARNWANVAAPSGKGHVYEVEPTGPVEDDPHYSGPEENGIYDLSVSPIRRINVYQTGHPLRVIRRVPPGD